MAQATQAGTPVIELRHVDKHYGQLHVLKDINLSVKKGEVVVIIGPSGSGKSTLCRTINRLETIDSGEILIDGQPLPKEGRKLAELRAQVGMVFQQFNLFAHKTILDNVTLGPREVLKKSKAEAEQEAMQLLKRVGVDSQASKVPAQLSGGQQQRVAMASEGMTMVIVTHEMNFAKRVADRIIFMDAGAILEENTPEEFFTNPATQRARDFLESIQAH